MTTDMLAEHDLLAKEDCDSSIEELSVKLEELNEKPNQGRAANVCLASRLAFARFIGAYGVGDNQTDKLGQELLKMLSRAHEHLSNFKNDARVELFAKNVYRRRRALEFYLNGNIKEYRELLQATICEE